MRRSSSAATGSTSSIQTGDGTWTASRRCGATSTDTACRRLTPRFVRSSIGLLTRRCWDWRRSRRLNLPKPVAITPPGLNRVFYSDDGATAVEAALKLAWQYQRQKPGGSDGRDLFASVGGAYHGDTLGSVSIGNIELFHRTYGGLLFPTVRVPSPVTFRTPPGYDAEPYLAHCFDELERVIVEHRERLVAFILEPLVQGAAGILVHPPGYLRRVRELTAEHGIPLIADEVAVGFGRTGTMFACEQEQVAPDILCLAKGITGGYLPLAATLTTDEIFEAFLAEPHAGRTFFHGHTYTGNPLACAAALASLDLFAKNNVLDNVRLNAERLRTNLTALADHPHVGEVRRGDHGRHRTRPRPRGERPVRSRPANGTPGHARRAAAGRHHPPAGRRRGAHAGAGDAGRAYRRTLQSCTGRD